MANQAPMNPSLSYLTPYAPIAVVLGVAGFLGLALTAAAATLGPKRPNPVKDQAFECGSPPSPGDARQRFSVKFYVVALLFIVFDVETVFLYPWATLFRSLGWFGFAEMGTFVLILSLGLVYVWRKGALEWD
jgi:NADH-quinone oxidoreductase subunit A